MLKPLVVASLVVVTLSSVAADTPAKTLARSDNVMFVMPDGWRRKDKDSGVTILAPESLAAGQWAELRLPPPEAKDGSSKDHLARGMEQMKKLFNNVRELAPAETSKLPCGDATAVAIAGEDAAQNNATLIFVLCYVETADLVQPFVIATNSPELFQKHEKTFTTVLDSVEFANQTKLADGEPTLTMLTVVRVIDFLEWALDVPFTQEQKVRVQEELVKAWKANHRAEIDGCLELIKVRQQIREQDKAKQDLARVAIQEEALKTWRQGKDDIDKYLVAIYDAGHKPIVAGDPPLTRQVTDAVAELTYFMASQLDGGGEVIPSQEVKDEFAAKVAKTWGTMDPEARKQTAQMPLLWAAIRAGWPEAPAEERKKLVEQFGGVEQVKELAAHFAKVRHETQAKAGGTGNTTADYLKAMQERQRQHQHYAAMSNLLHQQHQTNMMIIHNMGNGWTYSRR